MWQLRKRSNNENLNRPGELPENWGPIFGMQNITEKLSDLSWLGENFSDMGWFELSQEEIIVLTSEHLLSDCENILEDEKLTVEEKAGWIAYIQNLKNVRVLPGFPLEVVWPVPPK
jgi:hypothetical protein